MVHKLLFDLGLTKNEVTIYITLLKRGPSSAYELSKLSGIYRVHVYDKLEQLIEKGLVTYVIVGRRKTYQAASPVKILDLIEERKRKLDQQRNEAEREIKHLIEFVNIQKSDTTVEVFRGNEGLKFFIKDVLRVCSVLSKKPTAREVLITGIDDKRYYEAIPAFMPQYFREAKRIGIIERVITLHKKGIFRFDKKTAPTTYYRFLDGKQFNPTNTFVYGSKVALVCWGTPVTVIMIENKLMADTYRDHFEHLWKIAKKSL